jgi:hypothetical protein
MSGKTGSGSGASNTATTEKEFISVSAKCQSLHAAELTEQSQSEFLK